MTESDKVLFYEYRLESAFSSSASNDYAIFLEFLLVSLIVDTYFKHSSDESNMSPSFNSIEKFRLDPRPQNNAVTIFLQNWWEVQGQIVNLFRKG